MKINGFEVEIYNVDKFKYVRCNKESWPAYHITQLVRLANSFMKVYELDKKDIVLQDNLFGMVIKFEDLEKLYNKIIGNIQIEENIPQGKLIL